MQDQESENNQMREDEHLLYEIQLDYTSGHLWEDFPGAYTLAVTYTGSAHIERPVSCRQLTEVVEVVSMAQEWISQHEKKQVFPRYAELKLYW